MSKGGNARICLEISGKRSQRMYKIFVYSSKKKRKLEKLGFVKQLGSNSERTKLVGLNFKRFYYWYGNGASMSSRLSYILMDFACIIRDES